MFFFVYVCVCQIDVPVESIRAMAWVRVHQADISHYLSVPLLWDTSYVCRISYVPAYWCTSAHPW